MAEKEAFYIENFIKKKSTLPFIDRKLNFLIKNKRIIERRIHYV
jgi:hypothetical protein